MRGDAARCPLVADPRRARHLRRSPRTSRPPVEPEPAAVLLGLVADAVGVDVRLDLASKSSSTPVPRRTRTAHTAGERLDRAVRAGPLLTPGPPRPRGTARRRSRRVSIPQVQVVGPLQGSPRRLTGTGADRRPSGSHRSSAGRRTAILGSSVPARRLANTPAATRTRPGHLHDRPAECGCPKPTLVPPGTPRTPSRQAPRMRRVTRGTWRRWPARYRPDIGQQNGRREGQEPEPNGHARSFARGPRSARPRRGPRTSESNDLDRPTGELVERRRMPPRPRALARGEVRTLTPVRAARCTRSRPALDADSRRAGARAPSARVPRPARPSSDADRARDGSASCQLRNSGSTSARAPAVLKHPGRASRRRANGQAAGGLRDVADRAVVGPAAHDVAHRQHAGESPPRSTTRCRKPPRTIATAASSSDQSGAAKTRWDVRWSPTRSESGS